MSDVALPSVVMPNGETVSPRLLLRMLHVNARGQCVCAHDYVSLGA